MNAAFVDPDGSVELFQELLAEAEAASGGLVLDQDMETARTRQTLVGTQRRHKMQRILFQSK